MCLRESEGMTGSVGSGAETILRVEDKTEGEDRYAHEVLEVIHP